MERISNTYLYLNPHSALTRLAASSPRRRERAVRSEDGGEVNQSAANCLTHFAHTP